MLAANALLLASLIHSACSVMEEGVSSRGRIAALPVQGMHALQMAFIGRLIACTGRAGEWEHHLCKRNVHHQKCRTQVIAMVVHEVAHLQFACGQ
jgi:hypothetical protein